MATFSMGGIREAQGSPLDDPFYRDHGYTRAPVVIQCYLTLGCDLTCPHCLTETEAGGKDMPLESFKKLCREAAALGVREMLLTGGESLLRAELPLFIDCLQRHALPWSLNTARCPNPEQRRAIGGYPPVFVAVSLDGPREVHDAFRGKCGAFDDAVTSLRFFSSLPGTTVCAGTTVSTVNHEHLDDTFAVVLGSGAHRWGLHLLIPEGRARARKDLFLSVRQLRKLLKFVAIKRRGFPVSLCDELGYAGPWEPLVRDEVFYCAAGRAMCAVLPDGSVMPCSTVDPRYSEGNVFVEPLATVWNFGFGAQRENRPAGKCVQCQDWQICGSGCWLQRQHGAHCYRGAWKTTGRFKAAAGIGACLGVMNASAADPVVDFGPFVSTCVNAATGTTQTAFRDAPDPVIREPVVRKGIFGSKAGGGRGRGLRLFDDPRTVKSLGMGIEWLRQQQAGDGSWGGDEEVRAAATGVALLAILAHGGQLAFDRYGTNLEEGVKFLVKNQATDGAFAARGDGGALAHGIASWAVISAYEGRNPKDPDWRGACDKAIHLIVSGQRESGLWGTDYGIRGADEMESSFWQVAALRTAAMAAVRADACTNALRQIIEPFRTVLRTTQDPAQLAPAAYCLQSVGYGSDPFCAAGLDRLRVPKGGWRGHELEAPLTTWCISQFALLARGGNEAEVWSRVFIPMLMENQHTIPRQGREPIGYWMSPGSRERYGKIYATALCCLMLTRRAEYVTNRKALFDLSDSEKKVGGDSDRDKAINVSL